MPYQLCRNASAKCVSSQPSAEVHSSNAINICDKKLLHGTITNNLSFAAYTTRLEFLHLCASPTHLLEYTMNVNHALYFSIYFAWWYSSCKLNTKPNREIQPENRTVPIDKCYLSSAQMPELQWPTW